VFCYVCVKEKSHQLPFTSFKFFYSHLLELVYIDICGPTPDFATVGAKYYVAFLYAYSKYTWAYLLYSKYQISSIFFHFKTMAENETNAKLKSLQTDNA